VAHAKHSILTNSCKSDPNQHVAWRWWADGAPRLDWSRAQAPPYIYAQGAV